MSEIDDFLSGYGAVGQTAQALRKFVKANSPECAETLHTGWKVISYGRQHCAIAPHKNWVNLQFYHGAQLHDPSGRMEGTGKSVRHIKIKSIDDLDDDLASVIQASAQT